MRFFRFSLATVAMLCLAGRLWFPQAYSPSQGLPVVSYTAFEVNVPTEEAGLSLTQAARGWRGVTASTYSPSSGFILLSFLRIRQKFTDTLP